MPLQKHLTCFPTQYKSLLAKPQIQQGAPRMSAFDFAEAVKTVEAAKPTNYSENEIVLMHN